VDEKLDTRLYARPPPRLSPDPLVLAFYFIPQNDLIVQLIILRNRYDI
jgi:hypothetical protein